MDSKTTLHPVSLGQLSPATSHHQQQPTNSQNVCNGETEKLHQCTHCSKSYLFAGHLENHIKKHTKSRAFPCLCCKKVFKRRFELNKHEQAVHSQNGQFPCSSCGKLLNSKGALKIHQQRQHSEAKAFSCSLCPSSFSKGSHLTKHIRTTHDPNYSVVVKCSVCKLVCRDNYQLQEHMNKHTNEKPYSCHICGRAFAQAGNMKNHFKTHAEMREKPHSCIMCGKRFATLEYLKSHVHIHTREKPYSCSICGKLSRTKTDARNHSRIHSDKKPFSCEECPLKCRTKSQLTFHIRTVHRKDLRYPCQICGKAFPGSYQLNKHTAAHLQEKHHQCSKCRRRFACRTNLSRHLNLHNNGHGSSCPKCSQLFTSFWFLQLHYLEVHVGSNDNLCICLFCGKKLKSQKTLEHHLAGHTGEQWYFCSKCPNIYRHPDAVQKHEFRAHGISLGKKYEKVPKTPTEKTLKCVICHKLFLTRRYLENHLLSHTGERPFKCNLCNRSFKAKAALKAHKQVHIDEKTFSCSVCSARYMSKGGLKRHVQVVHERSNETKKAQCSICHKFFTSGNHLSIHMRIHTGERPFQCVICEQWFRTTSNLNGHILAVHTKEQPYFCQQCPSSFSHANLLNRHISKMHEETNL